jgi:hypothetical protein
MLLIVKKIPLIKLKISKNRWKDAAYVETVSLVYAMDLLNLKMKVISPINDIRAMQRYAEY